MTSSAGARNVYGYKIIFLAVLLWVPVSRLSAPAAQINKPMRVMVLYWYGKDFPTNVDFDRGVQKAFDASGVEYYPEYFEPNLFPGENQAEAFRDYLRT